MQNISLTKFTSASRINQQTFNKPLEQIQDYINNSINTRLQLMANKSAIIQSFGVLASDVSKGDLVYFDTKQHKFKKALSTLDNPGQNGQIIQSQSCRVQGIVLATQQDASGVKILKQGFYTDLLIDSVLKYSDDPQESDASIQKPYPGLYYLSSTKPGCAVLKPTGAIRQPCISYYGNGCFSVVSPYTTLNDNTGHVLDISVAQPLTCQNNRGVYNLAVNWDVQDNNEPKPSAIYFDATANKLRSTKVVSNIKAGLDTDVAYNETTGQVVVGFGNKVGKRVVATDITCKGAKYVVDNLLTYVAFPASSKTSAVAVIPVNHTADAKYMAKFWCIGKSIGGGSLSIKYYWMSQTDSIIAIPTAADQTTVITISSPTGSMATVQCSTGVSIPKGSMPGTLFIQMTNESGKAIQMFKCGCNLQLV